MASKRSDNPSLPLPCSLDEFLEAPIEHVRAVAPQTAIFAAGGTRRAGALAGVTLAELPDWSRQQLLDCHARILNLGVQHLISPIVTPQMFLERGLYGAKVFEWMHATLAGPEARAYYLRQGWRVRFICSELEPAPPFQGPMQELDALTRDATGPTLWYIATSSHDAMWRWYGSAFANGARTREEAVRMLYGEELPPASLCISFGKPMISVDLCPPLLCGEGSMQCYWTQRVGYTIDEQELRKIFYDYAYMRRTWRSDKTNRAEEAMAHRALWEHGPTLGLGTRVGPFWYPVPTQLPAAAEHDVSA